MTKTAVSERRQYSIGELARMAGVQPSVVRNWHRGIRTVVVAGRIQGFWL
jgi:transposase-like protein